MTSPLVSLPGAVQWGDSPVAAHYGNPIAEQRWLLQGALVDLSHRGLITVSGPDRRTWLNSVLSQELASLTPGHSTEALLLSAQGRVEHAVKIVDDGEQTWLITDGSLAPSFATWLDRMRFTLRVEVTQRLDMTVVGWLSPDSDRDDLAAQVTWVDPWRTVAPGGVQYAVTAQHPAADWTWREAVVDRDSLTSIAQRAATDSRAVAGILALEALRVAAWRPQLPDEADETLLPHEVDWLRTAVHLAKGCYRGQETVAKVHNLGHPPRRLTFLHLDGSESQLPAKGDRVSTSDGVDVGFVTSAALHHELGPIALAILKRTTPLEADLVVTSGDVAVAASQEIIVPPDAGAAANVPRLPRLGKKTRNAG